MYFFSFLLLINFSTDILTKIARSFTCPGGSEQHIVERVMTDVHSFGHDKITIHLCRTFEPGNDEYKKPSHMERLARFGNAVLQYCLSALKECDSVIYFIKKKKKKRKADHVTVRQDNIGD